MMRWMNRVARAEDTVVGSLPIHPVTRRDTFFLWFNTADLLGFDSVQVLKRIPSYSRRVTMTQFLEELEATPPAFVVMSGDWRIVPFPELQQAAIGDFIQRRNYVLVEFGLSSFAVRPDRVAEATRDGRLVLSLPSP